MGDEEILSELQTIRTLLTLEKKERLREIVSGLSAIQEDVLEELSYVEWTGGFSDEIADDHDVSKRHVRRETQELVDKNLIERQGVGTGTEYKKSALLRAADFANVL